VTAPVTSVLLTARDAAETVQAAVDSVLAQTESDLELVAVDDGSSDATPELLERAAARDPRVRVVRLPPGAGGLVAALEAGRRVCRGRYLMRMDADDIAHPRRLELTRPVLDADPRLAAVGCLVRSFPDHAVAGGRRRYDAWLNGLRSHAAMARERFVESPLAHPSVLLRARDVDDVGGYSEHDGPEDYDLWLRLFAAGRRFTKVAKILLFWREHPGRLSRTDPRYGRSGFSRVRARAMARHLAGRPAAVVGAGTGGRRLARDLLEAGAEVRFFLDLDPRKVGRAPHGVPVLGPDAGLRARQGEVLFSAVNAWGARAAVRAFLSGNGLDEGQDFFLAQ
jgi:glycosyltransferase involved in cell wall biosynthesis